MSINKCEFCEALLPTGASFCGNCGRVSHQIPYQGTQISEGSSLHEQENDATVIITPDAKEPWEISTTLLPSPEAEKASIILSDETQEEADEEERRRRAALLGIGIPLLGALGGTSGAQIPSVPGPLQIGQIPSLQGTPQIQLPNLPGSSLPTYSPDLGSGMPGNAPGSPSGAGSPGPGSPTPKGTGTPKSGPPVPKPGCWFLLAIALIVFAVIWSLFFHLTPSPGAPGISMNGGATIILGQTVTLSGKNFQSGGTVAITIDGHITISVFRQSAPQQLANTSASLAGAASQLLPLFLQEEKTIVVQSDGTFVASFLVDPSWTPGSHTIDASEALSHRTASLPVVIALPTQAPSATPTPTSTSGVTPTPRPTPTPTPTPPLISASPTQLDYDTSPCSVNVCKVTLYNSSASQSLVWSVETSGSVVSVTPSTGTIAANGSEVVTITFATGCNFSTTITFFGPANKASVSYKSCVLT